MTDIVRQSRDQFTPDYEALAPVVLQGDLSKLSPGQRIAYYQQYCMSIGLNPATQPLVFVKYQGKMLLYAKKEAAEQLRARHKVSLGPPKISFPDNLVMAEVEARIGERTDTDFGIVPAPNNPSEMADAIMKAISKAKRRVTFSILGLGYLLRGDEVAEASQPVEITEAEFINCPLDNSGRRDWGKVLTLCQMSAETLREIASQHRLPTNSEELTEEQSRDLRNWAFAHFALTQGDKKRAFKVVQHAYNSLTKMLTQTPEIEVGGDIAVFDAWMLKVKEKLDTQR